DGIRVTTLDWESRKVQVEVQTSADGEVLAEILGRDQVIASQSGTCEKGRCRWEFSLPEAELWSPENPKLYTCRVTFGEDVQEVRFGIRTVACTPEEGFCINGKRVILRGACIH